MTSPKQTFTQLLPKGHLGTGFKRAINRLRSTAYTAKVNLALDDMKAGKVIRTVLEV